MIGQILNTVGQVVGSAIEANQSRYNTNRTIQANREMANYQYSKDLEMWNKANEYNSPASQMSRYQSAGLNPNLIYGTGSASAGNTATTLPKFQAPTAEYNYKPPVDIANAIGMYQDFQVKQAQIDNLREQNRIYKTTADMREIDAGLYGDKETWIEGADGGTLRATQGTGRIKRNLALYNMEIKKAEANQAVRIVSSKLNAIDLQNQIREKTKNWFIANQLSNMASKALGAFGISKLAGRLRPAPKNRPWPLNKNSW